MAGFQLVKGGGFDLEKSLSRVRIGLAWAGGCDADVSVAALSGATAETKRFVTDGHFVSYCNPAVKQPDKSFVSVDGSIWHSGDKRSGDTVTEGDDEKVIIDLMKLPAETTEVTILATIYQAEQKGYDFAKVNAVATLYNDETNAVLATYPLGTGYAGATSVQVVSLYKNENGKWTYKALGAGAPFGLERYIEKWQN